MTSVQPVGERVLLVHLQLRDPSLQADLSEFKELALSAGAEVVDVITSARDTPDPKYFVGSGKAQEISDRVQAEQIDLVLFNHALSPSQERNLERLCRCRVVDRTGLILDIFAQRARTFEGKLQVELAQLKHLATRLIRGWTHLERQKGGIGLRGPGETQLEVDRRLIRNRIQSIQMRLEKVRRQRAQLRYARQRALLPTVALVGYTNAGKSTLFNALTGADTLVANRLFATLDPTLRTIELPHVGRVMIADTVGFIRQLPHDLVEAFRATLEETREAQLLVHVIDIHDEQWRAHADQVQVVLSQIAAHTVPQLEVYNKIDLLDQSPRIERDSDSARRVWLSATHPEGLALLREALVERLGQDMVMPVVRLSAQDARLRAQLYEWQAVSTEQIDAQGDYFLHLKLPVAKWHGLLHAFPELADKVE